MKKALLLILTTLVVQSCATPQSEINASASEAAKGSLPARDAWQSAVQAGAVQVSWIASFKDPQLTALVEEAVEKNLNLQVASANLDRARALARQAGASLSPTVNLSSNTNRSGGVESSASNTTALNLGLQVSWEADLWGRISSGAAQGTLSAQAAEADFLFAQYSIAANTALAYFAAIEAHIQEQNSQETIRLLERTLKIVQAQYDEGVASAQDLALTRSDMAVARERNQALINSKSTGLRSLELLLGRYPSADLVIRQALPALPAPPPAGAPAELLERRPDLVAAERKIAAAFNAVETAKAARLPSLSLTGNLGGASSDLSNLLNPANVAWSLGTSLLAPLIDGGRRLEAVNSANADQQAAIAQYADAALNAFGDVENSLEQGEGLAIRLSALKESEAQARKAYAIAEILHKEGESSLLDLLTVQQRLITAQSSVTSMERASLQQRVGLNLALGGSW